MPSVGDVGRQQSVRREEPVGYADACDCVEYPDLTAVASELDLELLTSVLKFERDSYDFHG